MIGGVMYNPYVKKGEWIDCDKCGSSHRRILPPDLVEYSDENGAIVHLSEEQQTQCYKCEPIPLYKSFSCKSCGHNSIIMVNYGESLSGICPKCGNDNNSFKSTWPSHFEKRPVLKGEAAELFNRIKKRNYGSTMPDY